LNRSDILHNIVSDKLVMTVIVINSLVLFLGAFPGLHKIYYNILFPIDYACTVFFVVELVLKVKSMGWKQYWASGWNIKYCGFRSSANIKDWKAVKVL